MLHFFVCVGLLMDFLFGWFWFVGVFFVLVVFFVFNFVFVSSFKVFGRQICSHLCVYHSLQLDAGW